MSKLTDLRKQIAQLEAEFARTAKAEMEASIGKVKALMTSLGVTIEHLGGSLVSSKGKPTTAKAAPDKKAAPGKAAAKRAGAGVAKYMDPKSGKTWTGTGRAPSWLDGKKREAFLIDKSAAPEKSAKVPAKKAKVSAAKKAAPAKKTSPTKKASAKVAVAAKKVATKKVAPKNVAAKKAAAKKAAVKKTPVAKTPVAKKAASKKVATTKVARKTVAAPASTPDTAPAAVGAGGAV